MWSIWGGRCNTVTENTIYRGHVLFFDTQLTFEPISLDNRRIYSRHISDLILFARVSEFRMGDAGG